MDEFSFFEPGILFREYVLLKEIFSKSDITQQELAEVAGIAPSMVNKYLMLFEKKGLIDKIGPNRRKMNYFITQNGIYRLQYLAVSYLREVAKLYSNSRLVFMSVAEELFKNGIQKIVLYGAGVVGETLLDILKTERIQIVCFVDDDNSKHGTVLNGIKIISPDKLAADIYDAVLIASFRHAGKISAKARSHGMKNIYIFSVQTDGRVSLKREE
jgi:predicted transcriptional regulator